MTEHGKGRVFFWDSISPALHRLLNLAIRFPVTLSFLTAGGRTMVTSEGAGSFGSPFSTPRSLTQALVQNLLPGEQ